jgi:hypothetical protein
MNTQKIIHDLKILPEYWRKVQSWEKKAEFRKNDRDFQAWDLIAFKPMTDNHIADAMRDLPIMRTPDDNIYIITHVLLSSDVAPIPKGYAVISIEKLSEWEEKQLNQKDLNLTLIRVWNNHLFVQEEKVTFWFIMKFYDPTISSSDYHEYDISIQYDQDYWATLHYTREERPNRLKPWMLLPIRAWMRFTVEHVRKQEMNEWVPEPVAEEYTPKKKR